MQVVLESDVAHDQVPREFDRATAVELHDLHGPNFCVGLGEFLAKFDVLDS